MSAAQPKFAADPRRRAMIGKVKIAQKELGLDDATYRAVLQRVTGRASAADCTDAQLGAVLDEFKAKGWKPKTAGGKIGRSARISPAPADHPSAKKARALWISLHQLGEVRNPSEDALEAFAKRQLGCARLQWADQRLTYRLIEALKAMAERAGWSQDLAGIPAAGQVQVLKQRLWIAMAAKLTSLGGDIAVDCPLAELTPFDGLDARFAQLSAAIHKRLGG